MFRCKLDEKQRKVFNLTEDICSCLNVRGEEINDWLLSLLTSAEEPKQSMFPKTPTAARTTRKRPIQPTIIEDEEENAVAVPPVRISRAAAKNACIKMKHSQQMMALNNKLRRPSSPSALDITAMSVSSVVSNTKKHRRGQPSSSESSYSSAVDTSNAHSVEVTTHIKQERLSSSSSVDSAEIMTEQMNAQTAVTALDKKKKKKKSVSVTVQKSQSTLVTMTINSPDIFSEEEDNIPLNLMAKPKNQMTSTVTKELKVVCHQLTPEALKPYAPPQPMSVKKRVEQFEKMSDMSPVKPPADEEPSGRITRTKARALNATAQKSTQQIMESSLLKMLARKSLHRAKAIVNKQNKINQEHQAEKENAVLKPIPPVLMSGKTAKATPLTIKPPRLVLTSANQNSSGARHVPNIVTGIDTFINKTVAPKPPSVEEAEEKKREELRKRQEKEDESNRRRKELMEFQAEEKRKKREENRQKVLHAREAKEREKLEQIKRTEREKEEKARQMQERGEQELREQMLKKKAAALRKAAEAEERRRIEEATRIQKIKEVEEEQRKLAVKRKKDAEEAEVQLAKRKHEEQLADALAKKKHAKKQKLELNNTFVIDESQVSIHQVPAPLRAAGPDDYELLNNTVGDSGDEDQNPKLCIPAWSSKESLKNIALIQSYYPLVAFKSYFGSRPTTVDLGVMFGNDKLKNLKRSSSAFWGPPPRVSLMPQVPR